MSDDQVKREARKELQKEIEAKTAQMGRELWASEVTKIAREVYKKYSLTYIGG